MHESDPFRVKPSDLTHFHWKTPKPLIFLPSVFILSNLIGGIQISHNRSIMCDRKSLRLRKYSHISAIILVAVAFLSSGKEAAALTADDVLNKMNTDQSFGYVSGLVDGLAYARWLRDKPDARGMQCIFGWYYAKDIDVRRNIQTWFERHLDKPVDALVYVLIKKECGE